MSAPPPPPWRPPRAGDALYPDYDYDYDYDYAAAAEKPPRGGATATAAATPPDAHPVAPPTAYPPYPTPAWFYARPAARVDVAHVPYDPEIALPARGLSGDADYPGGWKGAGVPPRKFDRERRQGGAPVRADGSDPFAPHFADKDERRAFVRRTFGLVTAMMLCVFALTAALLFVPAIRTAVAANAWIVWVMFFGFFGCVLALSCAPRLRVTTPHNYVVLFLFTAFLSVFVAIVASFYAVEEVLVAVGVVTVVVFALTLFATQARSIHWFPYDPVRVVNAIP